MYKKICFVAFIVLIIMLGAAACDTTTAEETTEDRTQEVTQTNEVQETKQPVWERSQIDVMEGINDRITTQELFDGVFSLSVSVTNNGDMLYALMRDGVSTTCGFSFLEDVKTGNDKLVYMCTNLDIQNNSTVESFLLGGAAMLIECDTEGEYETLSEAKEAFFDFVFLPSSNDTKPREKVVGQAKYTLAQTGTIVALTVDKLE